MENHALFVNLLLTSFLTGLIWFVQLVHYPSFRVVGEEGFARFHAFHMRAILPVVALPMLAELLVSGWLLSTVFEQAAWLNVLAFLLVLLIWLQTAVVFRPLHQKLHIGYNVEVIHRLVKWNGVRAVLWTLRLAALLVLYGVNETVG